MYIKEFLKQFGNSKIKIFVDMDGVIVDYVVGDASNFDKKRPLFDSIKKLEEINNNPNIELYILSATKLSEGINQKNIWLDKYAPFFKKENRIIISREENDMIKSSALKTKFIKELKRDGSVIIVIDDDPRNLKEMKNEIDDVVLLKDTSLID